MKINLYCIAKYAPEEAIVLHYQKQCKQFGAELKIFNLFGAEILRAQKSSAKDAQAAYTKALLPYIKQGGSYALHPEAKMPDTFGFAKILNQQVLNFFIGGAYGFEAGFLAQVKTLSLSPLTLGHKVAKIVLCEQIYRGLSILNHHPYHK